METITFVVLRAKRSRCLLRMGALFFLAQPVQAQVTEPNQLTVPQDVSAQEITDCEANHPTIPGEAVTLPALFEYRGEAIDHKLDARSSPSVFSPLCSFAGTLVLRGGGCKLAFGWYNAVDSGGAPPAQSEIYPLIPSTDPDVYDCNDPAMPNSEAFCPLAYDGPWTLKTFTAADIRADARYAGGLIGFALIGDPATDCKQTHFSQQELNVVCTNCTPNAPWITTLVYQSTATPDAFYMAFEDLPMSPTSFEGDGTYKNDGDFNDFVFFITGLTCDGGGEPCDTGLPGACAVGRTDCGPDGTASTCRQVVQGVGEACDNIDNDCNGEVDDGELCDEGFVCDRGSCVAECGTGEFRCASNFECVSGFCVDPLCKDVECGPGEACRAGDCVGACDGVVCPLGKECQLGRCVDLCAAVNCDPGQVCERGVCVADCSCRDCPADRVCAADGHCVEPGCESAHCVAGQVCVSGTCSDACSGAVCPGGAACSEGACGEPIPGVGSGSGNAGSGGSGGSLVITGSGGAQAGVSATSAGTTGTAASASAREQSAPGCACRAGAAVPVSRNWASAAALVALGLAFARRRRRR